MVCIRARHSPDLSITRKHAPRSKTSSCINVRSFQVILYLSDNNAAFLCNLIHLAASCPAIDEAQLEALNIDTDWKSEWYSRPDVYVRAYSLFCAGNGQYRVRKEVLIERGPALALQELENANTEKNQLFWRTQEMKCSVNGITGGPEWSGLVSCEPRNCAALPQEIFSMSSVEIVIPATSSGDKTIIWSGAPNVAAGMPLMPPGGSTISYQCAPGIWYSGNCDGRTYTPKLTLRSKLCPQKGEIRIKAYINIPSSELLRCAEFSISSLFFKCKTCADVCRYIYQSRRPNTSKCFTMMGLYTKKISEKQCTLLRMKLCRPDSPVELAWIADFYNYTSAISEGIWLGYSTLDGIRPSFKNAYTLSL